MDVETKKHSFLGLEVGLIGKWGALIAVFATPALIVPYWLWFWVEKRRPLSDNPEQWAQFGDYFAGIAGPIIGFASIMLLVATLSLQRTELREQRMLQEQSAKEAAEQNRILLRQSFEQSFFVWLRDYKQQISGLRFPKNNPRVSLKNIAVIPEEHISTGTDAIYKMVKFFFTNCSAVMRDAGDKKTKRQKIKNCLIVGWNQMYEHQGEAVRTSLRTLFGLIRWIDEHESLESSEKRHYAGVLRAQLSDHEMILIYLNGLTQIGQPMNDYINRYALFDNLEIRLYPTLIEIYDEANPKPYLQSAFNTDKAKDMHWHNS
ncbi:hypothetical protein D7I39_10950 [Allopusillimonas ginsengisoli]|nr:hypothetical protein D7I39_10950 [Allopusillimonas ginsengisoli]